MKEYEINGLKFLADSAEDAQQMAAGTYRRKPSQRRSTESTAELYARREREANTHRGKDAALGDESVENAEQIYARRAKQVEAYKR